MKKLLLAATLLLAVAVRGAGEAPDHVQERQGDIELALRSKSPRHAIEFLRERHPDDADAKNCIALLHGVGRKTAFSFTAVDGRKIDLKNYRGKVVLLEFWARWCKPCMEQLPRLKDLAARCAPRGFEVVCVSLDSHRDDAEDVVRQHALSWPMLCDEKGPTSPLARQFLVRGIPRGVLIDRHGRLRWLGFEPNAEHIAQRLEPLLAER